MSQVIKWMVPAQYVHFLYVRFHFMVSQNGQANILAQFNCFQK